MPSKERVISLRLRPITKAVQRYVWLLNHPSATVRTLSLLIFAIITFSSAIFFFEIIDPYPLKDWVYLRLTLADLGPLGALIYILMLAIIPLFSPLSLFIVTGSAAFGPILGILLSYIGTLINANLAFLLVKGLAVGDFWSDNPKLKKYMEAINRRGYIIVLLLQLATIFPFTLINAAAAAAGIKWHDFMKATAVGVWPCVIIYSILGDNLVAQTVSPQIYFSGLCVVAATLLMLSIRKRKSKAVLKNGPESIDKPA